jgi:hypothetical protein
MILPEEESKLRRNRRISKHEDRRHSVFQLLLQSSSINYIFQKSLLCICEHSSNYGRNTLASLRMSHILGKFVSECTTTV